VLDIIKIPLDPDQVCEIYALIQETSGKASVAKVSAFLAKRGVISPITRRPYSRQAVYLSMKLTERGRQLLSGK